MDWLEITLEAGPAGTEAAAAALTAAGFSELVIEDQEEFETFLQENRACWDYIDEALQAKLRGLRRIRLYLEAGDTAALGRLEALAAELGLPMTAAPLADGNWDESWKANYPPQSVGETLIALPYWLADTDASGRRQILLDPGLTFGTGAHPSTQMVMEALEKRVQPGDHCLDLGSGSGILSITALRLGAATAVGVDIDPKAEDIARANAARNGFSAPEFTALTGDVTRDAGLLARLAGAPYDLVLVNIVADVIIALAPVLPRFLTGGTLICSGILDTRLPEVVTALTAAGFAVTDTFAKQEWRCICAKRSCV